MAELRERDGVAFAQFAMIFKGHRDVTSFRDWLSAQNVDLTQGQTPLWVVKRDGSEEPFRPQKLIRALGLAAPDLAVEVASSIAQNVEREMRALGNGSVTSEQVGEAVMRGLGPVDEMARLRYLTVFRRLKSVADLITASV